MSDRYLDRIWKDQPKVIRGYYELLSRHERLCKEIEYILKTKIVNAGIEIAQVTCRAKTVSSFCEKIYRKSYDNPLNEVGDLAGVRIVFLYMSDLESIQNVIEKEFDILEKENKFENQDVEKFGYGALHHLVKMKKKHSGARYDDLKSLICEIQVRTILQDAWSVVAHHLSYKQEADVPKRLRRKLNALSGLFETADDQFESLRQARFEYIKKVEEDITSKSEISLNQPINLDNLVAYMAIKFPDRRKSSLESISVLFNELNKFGYVKLVDLDSVINKTLKATLQNEKDSPPGVTVKDSNKKPTYQDIGIVRIALSLGDKEYCLWQYGIETYESNKKYEHLINNS